MKTCIIIALLGVALAGVAQDKKPDPPKSLTQEQMATLDDLKAKFISVNRKISALPGYKELADERSKIQAEFNSDGTKFCGQGSQIAEPTASNDWVCQPLPNQSPAQPAKK